MCINVYESIENRPFARMRLQTHRELLKNRHLPFALLVTDLEYCLAYWFQDSWKSLVDTQERPILGEECLHLRFGSLKLVNASSKRG